MKKQFKISLFVFVLAFSIFGFQKAEAWTLSEVYRVMVHGDAGDGYGEAYIGPCSTSISASPTSFSGDSATVTISYSNTCFTTQNMGITPTGSGLGYTPLPLTYSPSGYNGSREFLVTETTTFGFGATLVNIQTYDCITRSDLWLATTGFCQDDVWLQTGGDSVTVTKISPATVTVNKTCAAPVSTWSSSTGDTSSPFTVNPPAGGQTVTITPGSLTEGYAWDSISPSSSQTVFPGGSATFNLPCHAVTISPTLSASPNPYQCGGTTTLTWGQNTTEATSCSASWTSSTAVSGSQVVTPSADPQTYSITCYGPNSSSGFASVSVPMAANSCTGASVNVYANPTSVSSGGNSTISWEGTNVSSCSPDWNWTSSTGASGSQLVTNILSTTSFPMSCISSVGGTNPSGSATVTVVPPNTPPVISISASPTSGTAGVVNPLITWSASGSPTSCTASGDWSGAKASSGSAYQGVLSSVKTYTYTLSCTNAYGTGTGSATVVVSAPRVDGVCSSAHWNCSAGTSSNNAGTGPWTWSCVGSGGGSTASCSESVGGFTYTLSNEGPVNVTRGSTVTSTVTRSAGTGTQAPVTLSFSVLPPDLAVQGFTYQSCTPTCASVFTFSADNTATLGAHTVTVVGSPESLNGPTSFTVNVLAETSPVVSCSPSSSSAMVGQPVTWSANVSGGTPPYTYVWSGTSIPTSPAPTHSTSNTTDTYTNTYTTTGLKHATVRVTDFASKFGDCTNGGYPGSDVQINFNPTFQEF
ncbi:MAG: hypothetical protein ACYC1K_02650 [Minisyncoccota bacterium]